MSFSPHTDDERRGMLKAIGLAEMEDIFRDIPAEVRLGRNLDMPAGLSEPEAMDLLERLAGANAGAAGAVCFLGGGAYDHYVPAIVDHILRRGEFYTSYTPYQAEISQGTLQAIYEYQSMICALTGMDVTNASLYDGGSAVAEAALMACRVTRRERILVSAALHPAYRRVLATYVSGPGLLVEEIPLCDGATDPEALATALARGEAAAVIFQEPNFFGVLEPVEEMVCQARQAGTLSVACVDPISLGVMSPPGDYGTDIAVGEGQSLGLGLNFGGPYLGFLAAREQYLRQVPGRIAGATVDSEGRRGFVLTLQAREQHIRRERATSNICTNQALMALAATVYMTVMGPEGLRRAGELCLKKAHYAAGRLRAIPGVSLAFERPFFKEFTLRLPVPAERVVAAAGQKGISAGLDLGRFVREMDDHLLVAVTERRTRAEIDALTEAVEGACR